MSAYINYSVGCKYIHPGVSINFGTSGYFSITGRYYFERTSFVGGLGPCPLGKFLNLRLLQIHFPAI